MTTLPRVVLPVLFLIILAWIVQSALSPRRIAVTSAELKVAVSAPDDETSFRILFGLTDANTTKWDGSLTVQPGRVARVEPWRFDEDDTLDQASAGSPTARWKMSTHPARAFAAAAAGAAVRPNVVANGIIATFRELTPNSVVSVETAQGKFQFRPSDISYGRTLKRLDGRTMVDRVPSSTAVARSRDDQDFPASAVDREGRVWVTYLQF